MFNLVYREKPILNQKIQNLFMIKSRCFQKINNLHVQYII